MCEQPGPLTASLYALFLACPRRAWYEYSRPRLNRKSTLETRRVCLLEQATETILPRIRHDLRFLKLGERIEKSALLLRRASTGDGGRAPSSTSDISPDTENTGISETTIAGAAIPSGPFIAEPDLLVLHPEKGCLEIISIKTASNLKGAHIMELAWHTEILSRVGIFPGKISLVHINRHFTLPPESLGGDPAPPDYRDLFMCRDVTKRVCSTAAEIGKSLETFAVVLGASEPPPPSPSCAGPNRCLHGGLCRPGFPKHNVFTLHQGGRTSRDLYEQGIIELKDVPEDFGLSRKQKIQIVTVLSGKPFIDPAALAAFTGALDYPLSFLDFETFSTAVPLYRGVTPWEHVPFAFSLHLQTEPDAVPSHSFFIADETSDPRPPFFAALNERIPREGSILVYNRRFEAGIVRGLGAHYPLWKLRAEEICSRMADLLVPFQDFRYYHPDQTGRISMKKVLPALTGRNYSDLAIGNGEEANSLYADLVLSSLKSSCPSPNREKVREALKAYCSLDTEGMVLILGEIRRAAGKGA